MRAAERMQKLEEGVPISKWQTKQTDQILVDFPIVFLDTPGTVERITHAIHTPPGVPVHVPARPMLHALRDIIEGEVHQMLKLGVIEESCRLWRSALVLILKPDRSVWF